MNNKYKKSKAKKKILIVIAILIVAIIPLCFLYSIIQLIMEPAKIFAIEKGKIYKEEQTTRIHNKRRKSFNWRKL